MNKRTLGSRYEQVAAAYLSRKGFQLREMNFRCRIGEIDLILEDGDTLVFAEVKYRSTNACGVGEEHVDKRKQQVIGRVAAYYLLKTGRSESFCRFDVVAIDGEGNIDHIPAAFEL